MVSKSTSCLWCFPWPIVVWWLERRQFVVRYQGMKWISSLSSQDQFTVLKKPVLPSLLAFYLVKSHLTSSLWQLAEGVSRFLLSRGHTQLTDGTWSERSSAVLMVFGVTVGPFWSFYFLPQPQEAKKKKKGRNVICSCWNASRTAAWRGCREKAGEERPRTTVI